MLCLLFDYRVKQASRGKHEWASLPVPTSKNYLLVTGLLAGTGYQFSVLPQNKLGSGSFSEIVSARTQGFLEIVICFIYSSNVLIFNCVPFHQLHQQKNLQLSLLSQSWTLQYRCQLTRQKRGLSSSGHLLWVCPFRWQIISCRPAGIKDSGSSSAATSVPIKQNYLYTDC